MSNWTPEELDKIGAAEELQIAWQKEDGILSKPVIIWVVRVGAGLFVRSVKGSTSGWYRGTQIRHAGRIWAGGVEKDVTFAADSDPEVNARIDAEYLEKYRIYPQWSAPMVVEKVKETTIKLVPR